MKKLNWEIIEASEPGGSSLEPGAYVCRITAVEDVPGREYLWIVYDVAEGPRAGHYSDAWGRSNVWAHRFTRSYKESAQGMFKAFLLRLEESNRMRGFKVAQWQERSDEQDLVGLEFGALIQKRYYTNDRGEDKETLEVARVVASQDVRTGEYAMPEPRDDRERIVPARASGAADPYDDVPFTV